MTIFQDIVSSMKPNYYIKLMVLQFLKINTMTWMRS